MACWRHALRSSSPTRSIAWTIAGSVSHRKPQRPCSMSSVAAPTGRATTGVPHAMASTITRPKGSGHWIGNTIACALPEESHLGVVIDVLEDFDVGAEQRCNRVVPVLVFLGFVALDDELQRSSAGACDSDCPIGVLAWIRPADVDEVVAPGSLRSSDTCRCRCRCGSCPRTGRSNWRLAVPR